MDRKGQPRLIIICKFGNKANNSTNKADFFQNGFGVIVREGSKFVVKVS